jgi:hypothetical protein
MRKRRPCLVQPRTLVPVPSRATLRALAWRGKGQTFGSLSRQTLSALRPATGRGFAANGDPSSPGVRAPTRSRSCTLAQAHERANPVAAFRTSSETEAPRSRPPRRSVSHHRRGRPSDRLGARASGQVSAGVRPHARTQANTTMCHRGAHLSVPRPRVNSNPRLRPSHHRQESPVLDRDLLFARRRPRRVVRSLSTFASSGRSLSPPTFCSRTPAPAGVEPCSSCPNGARACSRARTPSQASCHAAADTPVVTPQSSSHTEPLTLALPCSSGSFISRPHARASARPSYRLCCPGSSPVNTLTRVSRTWPSLSLS